MKCEFLSASGANVYEQCPLRYYAKYELGKSSGTTPQIGAGLLAHKALELYYRPGNSISKEDAFSIASKEEFCPDRSQFESARAMVYNTVSEEPKEMTNTITTELNFDFFLESGAAARGFIDRVDLVNNKTIRIVDYKTGEFVPSIEELESGNQTNIYALWVFLEEKFSGIENVIFNYKYLRSGNQKTINITKDMAYLYMDYFDHLYHAIKNDETHKPTMNSFCWNCEHRGQCQEYLNAMSVIMTIGSACGLDNPDVVNPDDVKNLDSASIIDVYNAVSTMSTNIDKEKKLISSWLVSILRGVSSGVISSDKSVAKLSSRKMTKIKPEDAKNIVRKYHLEDGAISLLSAQDMEKIIAGNADARKEYESVLIQTESASYPTVSKKK